MMQDERLAHMPGDALFGVARGEVAAFAADGRRSRPGLMSTADDVWKRRVAQCKGRTFVVAATSASRAFEPAGSVFCDNDDDIDFGDSEAVAVDLEPAGDLFSDSDDDEDAEVVGFGGRAPFFGEPVAMWPSSGEKPSTGTTASTVSSDTGADDPPLTTVMLQRIPFALDEDDVYRVLDTHQLQGTYDMVYMPRNRKKHTNLGYCFVNFVHPVYAAACVQVFNNRPFCEGGRVQRICSAEFSKQQGAAFLAERSAATASKVRERGRGAVGR